MGVRGTGPTTGPVSGWLSATASATAASSAIVGYSKSCRGVSRSPAWLAREITWMLRIESPPKAKKFSRMPTLSRRSTSRQIQLRTSSRASRGASWSASGSRRSGTGRARRFTLPLGSSGSSSSVTKKAGTM